jgi:hypothetical protein
MKKEEIYIILINIKKARLIETKKYKNLKSQSSWPLLPSLLKC